MQRDEAMLVSQAAQMGFEDFYRALRYWKQLADPEGADAAGRGAQGARNVYLEPSIDGMFLRPDDPRPHLGIDRLRGAQPPGAHPFRSRLRRGQGPPGPDRRASTSWPVPRPSAGPTPSSRWRRAAGALRPTASSRHPSSPSWSATRRCTGASASSRTAPSSPRLPSCPGSRPSYFERAIFSLGTRVDVSVRARLFSGGTRRALEVRDRMCTHPYCYEPAANCQGDHIEPYAEGGETTQENGRLLCGFHNRLRIQDEQRGRPPPGTVTVV